MTFGVMRWPTCREGAPGVWRTVSMLVLTRQLPHLTMTYCPLRSSPGSTLPSK